ncbi:SH3 domain-containing protein [Lipomyces kononenkoae]|uniref:SH3 domain-containing protein n=1 Tax=Lipomyces kononenkoae TaxID=34357 RepID=A0ACC3T1R5_LIPKO
MSDMNTAFINRSLTTIHNELDTLKAVGVITQQLFDHITETLPKSYSTGMAPFDLRSSSPKMNSREDERPQESPEKARQPPPPPRYSPDPSEQQQQLEVAEAIYDYRPSDASDLALYRGAPVVILEKINPDWWRGRDKSTNREGIFPSSYVRIIGSSPAPPVPSPSPYMQQYPPQQQYMPMPIQPYSAPSPQPYYPPVQQQVDAGNPEQKQESNFERQGKKFGRKLGNAMIFGAGATLGSDIVNSIL